MLKYIYFKLYVLRVVEDPRGFKKGYLTLLGLKHL